MDFPILDTQVYGHPLVYLDNAATTQKPQQVVDALTNYYLTLNSNIHRGTHYLATRATERYEAVRLQVQQFIHAASNKEIVFTRGTTESINLVAYSWGLNNIRACDEIAVSVSEHHSNMLPWQMVSKATGAKLNYIECKSDGSYSDEELERAINSRTKLVAVNHVSNTLGTVNPIKEMVRIAHSHQVPVLVDGAQAVAHMPVDVQDLRCDFYCFSGHKMYAPMGVGVMYGREELLNQLPPYQGGGEMIKDVTFEKTTYNELPYKFEAGTPSVGDVLGLGAAIDFIQSQGIDSIVRHEEQLMAYAMDRLATVPNIRFFGTAPGKVGVISFLIGNAHPYDVGTLLDKLGVAVRTGHHCTQPIMDRYGIPGTVRASFACYTTTADIDALHAALLRIEPMLM